MTSHFVRNQLPAIVWAIVIYVASSIPSARLPKVLGTMGDKLLHFIVFFVFGLLLYRGLSQRNGPPGFSVRQGALAVAAVVVYGVADELHQSFVPGRSFDVWDMVADGLGGAVAVAWFFVYHRYFGEKADAPV